MPCRDGGLLRRLSLYQDRAVSSAEPDRQLPEAQVPPSARSNGGGSAMVWQGTEATRVTYIHKGSRRGRTAAGPRTATSFRARGTQSSTTETAERRARVSIKTKETLDVRREQASGLT
jgi:hypothetical protein